MFPRNTSLSYCVLYEWLKICGQPGGLNPGRLNADDSQVMICDMTLYSTSGDGVIGSTPNRTLGVLGSSPSHTFSVQLWHIIIWLLNATLYYILYTVESVWWGSLPLSSVYFVFPRNTSLSYCVVWEIEYVWAAGGLNPSQLDVYNQILMWQCWDLNLWLVWHYAMAGSGSVLV